MFKTLAGAQCAPLTWLACSHRACSPSMCTALSLIRAVTLSFHSTEQILAAGIQTTMPVEIQQLPPIEG